jgi:serine/threonine-protein kinase
MGVAPHVRRRRTRLAVAIILLLAITVGAVGWWLGYGRWTAIPDLLGKDQNAAIDLLQEAGLDPDCCEEIFSEEFPAGAVITTEPPAGEAIRGTDVRLTVSKGPERFVIPTDLVQQPVAQVEETLQADFSAIQYTLAERYDDDVAQGLVLGFDPAAGTELKRGQVVTVIVSLGREPVVVPDVRGQAPDVAQANLEAQGFVVQRGEDGRSAEVDKGEVMATDPAPGGEAIPYGSTVTIVVSIGVPIVEVPDLHGLTEDEAVAALQAIGLKADVTSFFGNRVRSQSPGPGEKVEQGSTVKILVSFG